MRRFAVAAAAVLLVGCSSTHSQAGPAKKVTPPTHTYAAGRISIPPAERDGFWVKLQLSPDLKWWLAQWSGECEVQTTYLIPAKGGKARPINAPGVESRALGWKGRRARVLFPHGACGGSGDVPAGVYLVDPETMKLTLVRRVKPQSGGA